MKEPLISIIVPIYNVEAYISDCLNSILEQKYSNYEVILVNDGSTDSSQDLCEKYVKLDQRVKLYSKPNGGLSSARNYGIDNANGEYVIFIDSDDYWTDINALNHLANIADNTGADIVRGEYKEVDDAGNETFVPFIPDSLLSVEYKKLSNYVFFKEILCRGHFSWLFLIRRSVIGNFRFCVTQKFQEDMEFNIRFFSVPRTCVYTSLRFYAYRKRANSIITTPSIDNLMYSFNLSSLWYNCAQRITDENLRRVYVYNSIYMYYWTLETVSSDIYYKKKSMIIDKLLLNDRQLQTKDWAKKDGRNFPLVIYLRPYYGILLLRYTNALKTFLVRCKNYFKLY